MNNYDINAIESLSFKEGVQRRIQMYLGSSTTEGLWQGLKEIINNSTDEALAGYGNKIIITVKEKDQEFSVRDFGRSVPFGFRENGENVLVSIFSKAHTGGKFDHKAYAQSVGTNGIGSSATCLSATYFQVESYRDGTAAIARFENGDNVSYKEIKTQEPTGTYIFYSPSKEVFKDAEEPLTYQRICDEVKNISYLNSGVKFIVINKDTNEEKEYYSKNGISDFILDKVNSPLMKKPILCSKTDETDEVEVALIWTKDKEQFYCFVNGGYCNDGGTPITGAKTSITNTLKRLIGKEIEPELFRKGLCYVINCKVANPSFEGQTKNRINNSNLRSLASQAVKEGLEQFGNSNEFKTISDMIIVAQKAERAAERERQKVLNADKDVEKEIKKKAVMGSKLKDCRIHDENSVLYITEGDSALGSFTASRDSTYVAAMPIRGKIINALKNPLEDVLDNEEVKDIAKACGCGILEKTNVKKLRYGKICFAADADPDGYAIVCLLLVLFYQLMPELIKAGKIYWAQFPLYEVYNGKQRMFAYDDDELAKIIHGHPNVRYDRNKGLGEMDSDAFAEAAFGPNARMIQFTMNDVAAAQHILEVLLGKKNAERTDYIFKNVDFSVIEGE
jgi:DNA gyrase/topoisomerase IV subunit B